MTSSEEVTHLLHKVEAGDHQAAERLMPLVYDELRRLASHYLKSERPDHTLQPTALVHEAYLRMVEQTRVNWQSRAHFFAVAASMMRRVLIDYARSHKAEKHSGAWQKLPLDEALALSQPDDFDLIALDDALKDLSRLDEQQGRIVELRFFGGLTLDETAEVMGISRSTVKRDWLMAKAWLFAQLSNRTSTPNP